MPSQRKDLDEVMQMISESKDLSFIYGQLNKDIKNIKSSIKVIESGIIEQEQDLEYVVAYIEGNMNATSFLKNTQAIVSLMEYKKILRDIISAESHLKSLQKSLRSMQTMLRERNEDLVRTEKLLEKFIDSIEPNKVISYEDFLQKRRS